MVFVSYSQAAEPKSRFHGEESKACFRWAFWSWMVWLFVTGFPHSSNNESCSTLQVLQPWAKELYIIFYITLLYYNTTLVSDRLRAESQSWILLCCCGWFIVLEYRSILEGCLKSRTAISFWCLFFFPRFFLSFLFLFTWYLLKVRN